MKKSSTSLRVSVLLATSFLLYSKQAITVVAQNRTNVERPPLTEKQALKEIRSAQDVAAKLAQAKEFVNTFPASTARPELVALVATEIAKLKDSKQAVKLAEEARRSFTSAQEQETITPILLDAYAGAGRADDVFKLTSEMLTYDPENLRALIQMTLTGTEQAKKKNKKYVTLALQYGMKAIELIEADRKPADMETKTWEGLKLALPQLYQQTAVLNLVEGNNAEAQTRMLRAVSLDVKDPYPLAILGRMLDDEYTKRVAAFSAMAEGESKASEKKNIEQLLDKIIEKYVRSVALSIGKIQHQLVMRTLIPHLITYYRFRHNNSIAGLQQLLDQYRQ